MTPTMLEGTIVKGVGGLYYARDTDGAVHILRAKGIFRKQHITPLVGDRVLFSPQATDEHRWIEEILPRDNELLRPPVANIRSLVLVIAPQPEPDFQLLDTLLVRARAENIQPIIVINKCDLDISLADHVRQDYAKADVPIWTVSASQGEGIDALRQSLRNGICCFAGQSGVGKSTLINALTGLTQEAGEISPKIARGRNTTRHAELLVHNGLQVLDTAGFSLLELWDQLEPIQLKEFYPEFASYEGLCRFQPCYHHAEPGCAVLEALRQGDLSAARMERYQQLLAKVLETWRNRYE